MQASDDEQEERGELPPVTADEGDDDNDTSRTLSDDNDDDDDEPRMPTKRAKFRDGQPRRVKPEKPPVSLPATKVFERDTDGSVPTSNYQIPLTCVTPIRYFKTIEVPSLYLLTATLNRH